MGLDQVEVRAIIKKHIQGFLSDMSPLVIIVVNVNGVYSVSTKSLAGRFLTRWLFLG